MKVVIQMKNNEIIVIYQETNQVPQLKKINNDISEFEKLVGRQNRSSSLRRYCYCMQKR